MNWLERLEKHWQERDLLPASPPVSNADIQRFEQVHAVRMPFSVRSYFQVWNGMDSRPGKDMDENGLRFMPFLQLRSVGDFAAAMGWELDQSKLDLSSAFVFIDYLQWCGAFAFDSGPINHGTIYLLGSAQPRIVASSFEHFIHLYLENAKSIYEF